VSRSIRIKFLEGEKRRELNFRRVAERKKDNVFEKPAGSENGLSIESTIVKSSLKRAQHRHSRQ
jgi:hypothetical protein